MERLLDETIEKYVVFLIQGILAREAKTMDECLQVWAGVKTQPQVNLCSYIMRKGKTKGYVCGARAIDGNYCVTHKKCEQFQRGNISLINPAIDHEKNDEEIMKTAKLNIDCSLIDFEKMELFQVLEEITDK